MTKTIGIGVVGFGWMGQAHTRAYRDIPVYFPETGIQPAAGRGRGQRPRTPRPGPRQLRLRRGHLDWRELIARDDIDVVDVTAPNALHREIVEAAAAAGKHISCEKPVGIDPEATAAIELAGRRAGVITGCGYNYRWAPLVQYTRQLIADGRLGELTHYRGRFFSMYGRDRLGLLSWRFLQEEAGYGVLSDLMSHAIDMAQFMCGPISRVVAVKETFIKQRPLPMPGAGTHYDRGKPGDPTGAGDQRGLRRRAGRVRERGARHARVRPLDRRAAELDGLRAQRLEGRASAGITRSSTSCACTFPRSSPTTGSSRSSAATPSRTRGTSSRAAATRSATRTSS